LPYRKNGLCVTTSMRIDARETNENSDRTMATPVRAQAVTSMDLFSRKAVIANSPSVDVEVFLGYVPPVEFSGVFDTP